MLELLLLLSGCTWIPDGDAKWREDPFDDGSPARQPCADPDGPPFPVPWYRDADVDHFGDDGDRVMSCIAPDGYVQIGGDCADDDPTRFPGTTELCNGVDDDCDGDIDEDLQTFEWHLDADGDQYGADDFTTGCLPVEGAVNNGGDCDDADPGIHPNMVETCNGVDDDCDGETDELLSHTWYADTDGDGYGDPDASVEECGDTLDGYVGDDTDCDDTNADVHPRTRDLCDGIDDDCDGVIDDMYEYYVDADGDTFGDANATPREDCEAEPGEVPNGDDCDDTNPSVWGGATEVCDDAIDNDCDGIIDRGDYYPDADGDGLGDRDAAPTRECGPSSGMVGNNRDCDDGDDESPLFVDGALGTDGADGTVDAPLRTIQEAVDAAPSCVAVAAGTYDEALDLDYYGGEIWGMDGSSATTIDPGGVMCDATDPSACAPAVTLIGRLPATIRGFTITGGSGMGVSSTAAGDCDSCTVTTWRYCGGGLYVESANATLDDVVITENQLPPSSTTALSDTEQLVTESSGGGICIAGGSVTATDTDIVGNAADSGAGVFVAGSGTFTLTQGYVAYNAAISGAVTIQTGSAALTNAVVACNTATDGIGGFSVASGATATLDYVTLAHDAGTVDGGELTGDVTLQDSVLDGSSAFAALSGVGTVSWSVLGNDPGALGDYVDGGSVVLATGVLGSVTCGGFGTDDFRPPAGSVAIDAASGTDTDGTPADAGAFGGPGGGWE